jgi:hypothetical protein
VKPVLAFVRTGVSPEPGQRAFVDEVSGWEDGGYRESFDTPTSLAAAVTRKLHEWELSQQAGPVNEQEGEPYLAGSGLERRTGQHVRAGQVTMRLRPPRETDRDRLRAALAPLFDRHDVLVMPSLGQAVPATGRATPHRTWSHPC